MCWLRTLFNTPLAPTARPPARAQVYDRKRFLDGGFKHIEMYFPDGSCPSDAIILVRAPPGPLSHVWWLGSLPLAACRYCLTVSTHLEWKHSTPPPPPLSCHAYLVACMAHSHGA